MSKRILVLNTEVSGMNKYLFSGLRSRGWSLNVLDVPLPRRLYWWAAIKSFHFSKKEWRRRFDYHLWRLYKSSWCFKHRSRWCQKQLEKHRGTYDVVVNISSMHSPCVDYDKFKDIRYFVICSYTMQLSRKWDEWMTYDDEFEKWVELERQLYGNAEKVLTTNDNVRFSLNKDYGVDLAESINIGYGLTFDKFPSFEKSYDRKTALYVGFDFKRKGGFDLLEAFKAVRKSLPEAELVIIGPSKSAYHIEQDGVVFMGPIRDREVVQQHFRDAAIFVMPSICEPFGLTFLEAMAYKLPCVGTTVDAMPEIIRKGETGLLVPPRDPEALARAMTALLSDERKLQKMGDAAYERVKKAYRWELVLDRLEEALA